MVIAKAEESLPTSDFQLLTWLLHLTFLTLQISVRLPTSDFWLSTSNFGLQSFHHFPFPSSKWARFLLLEFSARAQVLIFLEIEPIMTANSDTSCYRNILNIRRIVNIPNITMCSLTETALPLLKESGQQYKFSFLGHVLRLPDNKPVREFVMYRFQLRGRGNPEDSEPCSPVVYLLSSGGSWYPVKWQSAVANGLRPPSMEEKLVVDCSSAEG